MPQIQTNLARYNVHGGEHIPTLASCQCQSAAAPARQGSGPIAVTQSCYPSIAHVGMMTYFQAEMGGQMYKPCYCVPPICCRYINSALREQELNINQD
nr:hypothetical protein CFP56_09705 [Quercus suber]